MQKRPQIFSVFLVDYLCVSFCEQEASFVPISNLKHCFVFAFNCWILKWDKLLKMYAMFADIEFCRENKIIFMFKQQE